MKMVRNWLKHLWDLIGRAKRYEVIQVSFINGQFPVGTDLTSLESHSELYTIHSRTFTNFTDACLFVANMSKINSILPNGDILVFECHGTKSGDLLAGKGERIGIDNVIAMCNETNVKTIILAACHGDRVVQKVSIRTDIEIVYNIAELYDKDAMRAVKRMVECLQFWELKKTVAIINNGARHQRWVIAGNLE